MGVTVGEMQMWGHIASIAKSLNRIANVLEARELRERAQANEETDEKES
jgi:hypothetical protein